MYDSFFGDINFPASSVSTFIKNFSTIILYGIDSHNELFKLVPEDLNRAIGIIYVMSIERRPGIGQEPPHIFTNRQYQVPLDNLPLYIEEMGCVLFTTEAERANAVNSYGGGGRRVVQSFEAHSAPLINGSYAVITCLSGDKPYYQVIDNVIEEIPQEASDYVDRMLIEHNIPRGKMQTHDVFIINTIIRKGSKRNVREVSVKTKIIYIDKSNIIPGNPIIFNYNGLVIFKEQQDAEYFIRRYGSVGNYMINVGLAATRRIQDRQIEELNKRAMNDKRNMVQTFSLMGGTSVCSIFAETLIKCAKEGETGEETFKKLMKIIGIGIIGIGGVLGIYFMYKKYMKYKEDQKKKG
jgi:hypothetical protein